MPFNVERTRDQLVDDFATVLNETEDLLKKASHETGERAKDLRAPPTTTSETIRGRQWVSPRPLDSSPAC